MNKFSLKSILTTVIGTSIMGSFIALPVRANEDNYIEPQTNSELILSQIEYGNYNPGDRFNKESTDWQNLLGLTGLAIGTGIVGYRLTHAYKPSLANSLSTINNTKDSSLLARVSPKLRKELLRLVHNQQTADRLLSGTLNSHPDRSANWLAEKVIYDLKRDR